MGSNEVLTWGMNYQFLILVILLRFLVHVISELRKGLNVELGDILFCVAQLSRIPKLKLLP